MRSTTSPVSAVWCSLWRTGLCGSVVWRKVYPLERLRAKHSNGNNVAVIKEGMNFLGLPAGRVREPIGELDDADRRELVLILNKWGQLEGETTSRVKGRLGLTREPSQ